MRVEMRVLLAASGLAVALAGCSGDLITGKDAPDEFAIVTKQPLIIPPDFNLHPPKPGAAPVNQLSPTDTAQAALFSNDPAQVASTIHGNYSQGEKILLAKAGAANASDSIRQIIAADNKNFEAADDSFTSNLLFGGGDDGGHALNADAEKARLDSMKSQGRPYAEAAPLPVQSMAPPQSYAPAVGTLPPIEGAQPAPQAYSAPPDESGMPPDQGAPVPASAPPQAANPAPAQTASSYNPPAAPVAGTLPDLDSPQASAPPPAPQQQPPSDDTNEDSGSWLDDIF